MYVHAGLCCAVGGDECLNLAGSPSGSTMLCVPVPALPGCSRQLATRGMQSCVVVE